MWKEVVFILQKLTRITIYTISFGRYINFLLIFKEFSETIPDVQQILAVRYMELHAFLEVLASKPFVEFAAVWPK